MCLSIKVPQAVEEHVGLKWTQADLLPINGSVEEVEQLREAMLAKRAAVKAKKQSKKANKVTATGLSQQDKQLLADNAAKEETRVTSTSQAADLAAAVAAQVQAQLGKSGGKRDLEDNPMSEQEQAFVKKFKASDRVPAHASKSVYSSIFMSSRPNAEKESYTCRSTSARGMNMT